MNKGNIDQGSAFAQEVKRVEVGSVGVGRLLLLILMSRLVGVLVGGWLLVLIRILLVIALISSLLIGRLLPILLLPILLLVGSIRIGSKLLLLLRRVVVVTLVRVALVRIALPEPWLIIFVLVEVVIPLLLHESLTNSVERIVRGRSAVMDRMMPLLLVRLVVLHGLVPLGLGHGNSIDLGIVLIQLYKLDGVGVVLINGLKTQSYLLISDFQMTPTQFFDQQSKIVKSQTTLLLVKIIEHFPKGQLISCYYFVQFMKT